MRCLAPDHTAKGHKAIKISLTVGNANCDRDLKRARNLDNLIGRASRIKGGLGPSQLVICDCFVIGRNHNQHFNRFIKFGQRQCVVFVGRSHPLSFRDRADARDRQAIRFETDHIWLTRISDQFHLGHAKGG